jgi:hypothetical protein
MHVTRLFCPPLNWMHGRLAWVRARLARMTVCVPLDARASRPHQRSPAATECSRKPLNRRVPEPYRTDSAAARNASVDKPRPDRM